MICNNCGLPFDESDLSQVGFHEHIGLNLPMTKGKKIITHAREIFPEASIQFCIGVHNHINGGYDMRTLYQETHDFKHGFYQSMEMDLNEKYTLNQ